MVMNGLTPLYRQPDFVCRMMFVGEVRRKYKYLRHHETNIGAKSFPFSYPLDI